MDESRVYRVGSGHTTTPPAGYTVAMYIDPVTNMAYGTTEWPPPKQYMSIAQRVIRRANLLKGRTVYCNHDDPEAQDACAPDWETLTDDQKKAAAAELRIYKDLLDIMVDLTGRYDAAGRCYGDPYNPGDIQCWDY
jgi:hypothetical protein